MFLEIISWLAVTIILITVTTILIHPDWRIRLGALAVQYLAMLWLVTRHLPFVMGSAKLIVGWMVVAILGMTLLGSSDNEDEEDLFFSHGEYFRIALMGVITLVAFGSAARIETSIPGLGLPVIVGGILLIGGGIIHLGVTSSIQRVVLGLLTLLSGFEILYAAVESAVLVTGLLALVNLGLAMAGAYLLLAGSFAIETEGDL